MSYQEKTFTKSWSTTRVRLKSIIEGMVVFKISEDTNGSFETANNLFHLISNDAWVKIWFISSTLVGLAETKVISAMDPQITGTRKATPSNLLSKLFKTLFIVFAAPVEAGIIFKAPALPLKKSFLAGPSIISCVEYKHEWY